MIEFLVDRKRTTLAILVVLIFAGIIGALTETIAIYFLSEVI